MTKMTLEQVRDQLREWGKVDRSHLCKNCGFWADAIDEVIKAQGAPAYFVRNWLGNNWIETGKGEYDLKPLYKRRILYTAPPAQKVGVTDEMVQRALEASVPGSQRTVSGWMRYSSKRERAIMRAAL